MKKIFTLFVTLMVGIGAVFASVTIDGIAYNLNEPALTAEVTSGEDYKDSIVIPESVVNETKTYRVTRIGDAAFANCVGLKSVTIPSSVASIGNEAFAHCSGMTSIFNYAVVPQSIAENVFVDVDKSIPLCVPCASMAAYGNIGGWKDFTNIIGGTSTITWNNAGGSLLERDENVPCGAVPTYDGQTPTKPATAAYTYTFAGWAPAIAAVTGDATYVATYTATPNRYHVNIAPDDATHGSVMIEGDSIYGSILTLTVTPIGCYHFTRWSDGNTDNPRTLMVTGNISLRAIFELSTFTISWKNTDGTLLERDYNVPCDSMPKYDGATPTQLESYNYAYRFAGWNPEIVPAKEDATYVAKYNPVVVVPNADNCAECQGAKAEALYGYLLMLNVKELKEQGYFFEESDVEWYLLRGLVDNLDIEPELRNDELIGTGFYYTATRDLTGTGKYYAVIDMSNTVQPSLCRGLMRSNTVDLTASSSSAQSVVLNPTLARKNQPITLSGLLPDENTTIRIFDAAGHLVQMYPSHGASQFEFNAVPVQGCYFVQVQSLTIQTTFKYIVSND